MLYQLVDSEIENGLKKERKREKEEEERAGREEGAYIDGVEGDRDQKGE